MFQIDNATPPVLGLGGLESGLTEEESEVQRNVHLFAEKVMRPTGARLDKLSAAEVVAEGSPIWGYFEELRQTGLMDLQTIAAMSNEQKSRLLPLIMEEMGWGDSGLTILSLATSFPSLTAMLSGNPAWIERFENKLGCWLATQPDRGSDVVDLDNTETAANCRQGKGNLTARFHGGDLVIDGQSSAWVSGAPIAECGLVNCACDYGDGFWNEDGSLRYVVALVPFDLPGVSKGKPLDKLGQRSLPQGEVFFDNVMVPKDYIVAQKEQAFLSFLGSMTFANMEMGATFTGVARAAFEHALDYVHERRQGGTEIINHQTVRLRIFELFQKVESCRAMSHRVFNYNYGSNGPHLIASITSKTWVTRMAFEVAQEALQLFGGNGLAREYPMEKLLRDARASLIEDGENTMLNLKGAYWLSRWHQLNNT